VATWKSGSLESLDCLTKCDNLYFWWFSVDLWTCTSPQSIWFYAEIAASILVAATMTKFALATCWEIFGICWSKQEDQGWRTRAPPLTIYEFIISYVCSLFISYCHILTFKYQIMSHKHQLGTLQHDWQSWTIYFSHLIVEYLIRICGQFFYLFPQVVMKP